MEFDKTLLAGSTGMLLLKLLEQEDMYGYQMIETLRSLSLIHISEPTRPY